MLTATVGKSLITKGYCKRLRTHSRRSERPKIMDVWRCKVLLRDGIRNNVGLYRCRLCCGDVFLSVSRHFSLDTQQYGWMVASFVLGGLRRLQHQRDEPTTGPATTWPYIPLRSSGTSPNFFKI